MNIDETSVDIRERGRQKDGSPIFSDRRLYMQFQAFGKVSNPAPIVQKLSSLGVPAVIYSDLNDPQGIGILLMHEDPSFFVEQGRAFFSSAVFADAIFKPELTMTGRTYAIGYEADLNDVLFERPKSRILDAAFPWAIWYPVRRTKDFESLAEEKKHEVMMNHGSIGRLFGKAGLAHDIRLACHGLDRNDNDFIIGVLSGDLTAASAVVQAMRKSQQTMHYIDNLGPFFVGKVYQQIRP